MAVVLLLVEESEEAIVLTLRDRVEFMVVALRATERQAEPDRRGGVDTIDRGFDPKLLLVDAAFVIDLGVAVKSSGDELFGGCAWKQIPSKLPDRELVERKVSVECAHHPVAVRPNAAPTVDAVSVRIRI